MSGTFGRRDVAVRAFVLAGIAVVWSGLGYFAAMTCLAVVAGFPLGILGYGAMALWAVIAAALLTFVAGDVL